MSETTPAVVPVPRPLARLARFLPSPTPKNLITFLITLILVVGEWRYGIIGGYSKLVLTVGTCVLTEVVLARLLVGRIPPLQSAYISGVSLTMLVRPQAGLVWPFVVGAALSIASKYVLRYKGRHLWNPSNFGLAMLVLLAPARVALLSHEFGNDLLGNAVIWSVGLLVAARARILHVSVTYALAFVAFAALRSGLMGTPLLAEVAPITGPMYQLLVFFMLTDPRTTVRTRRGRVLSVLAIALLESLFRTGLDLEMAWAQPFAPAPPILALAIVGPLALALELRRDARRARAS